MKRLVWLLLLFSTPALAAGRAKPAPILRLETGGHLAPIHHIGVDKSGQWLLTVSADRTARVWDLKPKVAQLTRTLRVEIGAGPEGSLFAGAISPDGKNVVLSAVTTSNALYVLDRARGTLLKYLPDLPETVLGLAYSPDGKRLAATSRHGVLVFDTKTWKVLFDDAYYGASYSADFDADNRLLTTSYDGSVRLYDADGKALNSAQPASGKKSQEAKFSPDGSLVAVGFADSSDLNLFSGKDMAFLRAPDLFGLTGGVFNAIAWSRDGGSLIAAGTAETANWVVAPPGKENGPKGRKLTEAGASYIVRAWSQAGAGPHVDFKPPVQDAILDLATTPDGSVVYASADASWGLFAKTGVLTKVWDPATASFQGMKLRLSPDGKAARFAYLKGGRQLAAFFPAEGKLEQGASKSTSWLAPDEKVSGKKTVRPQKKMELPIGPREVVRGAASSQDDSFFVFGTDVALRCVDQKGTVRWENTVPAAVRAVNVSSDDKLVVAAYADGTIRWHRAADGQLLLTFFPHADRSRWVAYTPSGYFTASERGQALVRFVENAGPDKLPKELPTATLVAKYRRPDVVALVLETLDEGLALEQANAAKKPAGKAKGK